MRLGAYLTSKKLSAAKFGQDVGVPNRSTMHRYVRGERFPPPLVLLAIREKTKGEVTPNDFADQFADASTEAA